MEILMQWRCSGGQEREKEKRRERERERRGGDHWLPFRSSEQSTRRRLSSWSSSHPAQRCASENQPVRQGSREPARQPDRQRERERDRKKNGHLRRDRSTRRRAVLIDLLLAGSICHPRVCEQRCVVDAGRSVPAPADRDVAHTHTHTITHTERENEREIERINIHCAEERTCLRIATPGTLERHAAAAHLRLV